MYQILRFTITVMPWLIKIKALFRKINSGSQLFQIKFRSIIFYAYVALLESVRKSMKFFMFPLC